MNVSVQRNYNPNLMWIAEIPERFPGVQPARHEHQSDSFVSAGNGTKVGGIGSSIGTNRDQ